MKTRIKQFWLTVVLAPLALLSISVSADNSDVFEQQQRALEQYGLTPQTGVTSNSSKSALLNADQFPCLKGAGHFEFMLGKYQELLGGLQSSEQQIFAMLQQSESECSAGKPLPAHLLAELEGQTARAESAKKQNEKDALRDRCNEALQKAVASREQIPERIMSFLSRETCIDRSSLNGYPVNSEYVTNEYVDAILETAENHCVWKQEALENRDFQPPQSKLLAQSCEIFRTNSKLIADNPALNPPEECLGVLFPEDYEYPTEHEITRIAEQCEQQIDPIYESVQYTWEMRFLREDSLVARIKCIDAEEARRALDAGEDIDAIYTAENKCLREEREEEARLAAQKAAEEAELARQRHEEEIQANTQRVQEAIERQEAKRIDGPEAEKLYKASYVSRGLAQNCYDYSTAYVSFNEMMLANREFDRLERDLIVSSETKNKIEAEMDEVIAKDKKLWRVFGDGTYTKEGRRQCQQYLMLFKLSSMNK